MGTTSLRISYVSPSVKSEICGTGEILDDRSRSGRKRPWKEKKMANERVANAFRALRQEKKAIRCMECGTVLVFAECLKDKFKKLQRANFCKERLCPMCGWRRTLRWSAEVSLVLHEAVRQNPKLSFVMLTLTQRNVTSEVLPVEVGKILLGWKKLSMKKELKGIAGWLRVLEVTRNQETRDWHPHIHALLAVNPDYWHMKYISQAKWVSLWRDVLKLDYDPVVDVHKVRKRKRKDALVDASLEVGKYTVKETDLLGANPDEDLELVRTLDLALKGRHLISWGGTLRLIARQLKSQIPEGEDLVHITEDHGLSCPVCGSEMLSHVYRWISKIREYIG